MSRVTEFVGSVKNAFTQAAVAVQSKFSKSTDSKIVDVTRLPIALNTQTAVAAKKENVAQKTRFERFTNFVHNNKATSIALLASAIFAVVYGVDKYVQKQLLSEQKDFAAELEAQEHSDHVAFDQVDQFHGASAILQQAFEEDDRFAPSISNGIGAEATEALTAEMEPLTAELSAARDAEQAIDEGLANWATGYNFPEAAPQVEPKQKGIIQAFLDEQALAASRAHFAKVRAGLVI